MDDPTPYCQLNGVAAGLTIIGMFGSIAFIFWASLQYLRWLNSRLKDKTHGA